MSLTSVDSLFDNIQRIVHLDLKGAPPKITYYIALFPYLKQIGATGILIEYEDMFPYSGDLKIIARPNCYSTEEVEYILSLAEANDLEVIPLVQTFGHLEFVLKHEQFRHLREVERYPNVLCPCRIGSIELVEKMLTQVLRLHPKIRWLHVGADEVWHLAQCAFCQSQLNSSNLPKEFLYFSHVSTVARFVRTFDPQITPIVWDDMFRSCTRDELRASGLGDLVEPMVWNYSSVGFNLPPNIWPIYAEFFPHVWVASAFKGASGVAQCIPDIKHYLHNHLNWIDQIKRYRDHFETLRGFALTGWQRYDHYSILCELLPAGIPSLVVCLQTILTGDFNDAVHKLSSKLLGSAQSFDLDLSAKSIDVELDFSFPGSRVFMSIVALGNVTSNLEKLTRSESFIGWFSPYNISRVYANPLQVEQIHSNAKDLHDNLSCLKLDLKSSLLPLYDDESVDEWMIEHVDSALTRIQKIVEDAQILLASGARAQPLALSQ